MTKKPEDIALTHANTSSINGSNHDLWIGENSLLTIAIDRQCKQFPPVTEHCDQLNDMIQGLARAAKAVVFHAENDTATETMFAMEPIANIAEAIILLTQLSDAVRMEAQV